MRSRRAKGKALKTVYVHTDAVSYLNCSAREDISVKGKKKLQQDWRATGLGSVKRQHVRQVTY